MENVKDERDSIESSSNASKRAPSRGNLSNGKRIKNNEDIHISFALSWQQMKSNLEYIALNSPHTRTHMAHKVDDSHFSFCFLLNFVYL